MSDLDDLRARVEAAKDRLGKAEDQRRDQSERLIDLIGAIQQGLDRKREELDEASARIAALDGEVAALTESLASAEARAEALAAEKAALAADLASLGEARQEIETTAARLADDKISLEADVTRLSAENEGLTADNGGLQDLLSALLSVVEGGQNDELATALQDLGSKVAHVVGEPAPEAAEAAEPQAEAEPLAAPTPGLENEGFEGEGDEEKGLAEDEGLAEDGGADAPPPGPLERDVRAAADLLTAEIGPDDDLEALEVMGIEITGIEAMDDEEPPAPGDEADAALDSESLAAEGPEEADPTANGLAESETTDRADPDAADLDPADLDPADLDLAPGKAAAGDDAIDAAPAQSDAPVIGPSSGEDDPLASLNASPCASSLFAEAAADLSEAALTPDEPNGEVDDPTSVKEIIQRVSRLADEMANLAGEDREGSGHDDEPRSAAS